MTYATQARVHELADLIEAGMSEGKNARGPAAVMDAHRKLAASMATAEAEGCAAGVAAVLRQRGHTSAEFSINRLIKRKKFQFF